MANNLKDIFSYGAFARFQKEGKLNEEERNKLESLMLLMQYSTEIRTFLRDNFVDTGLSQSKYYILLLLNEKSEELLMPSQLADFLSVSRGTISDIIDSMEKEGLLERLMCLEDRRKIQVCITEKGKKAIEGVVPAYFGVTTELMSCLSGEEVANLVSMTRKLSENMKKIRKTKLKLKG